jgi:hypothetical protein
MHEHRSKALTRDIDLAPSVKIDVLLGHIPVGGEIPRCNRWCNAKAFHQVASAGITQEPQAKFDIGQAISLFLAQFVNSF